MLEPGTSRMDFRHRFLLSGMTCPANLLRLFVRKQPSYNETISTRLILCPKKRSASCWNRWGLSLT